MVKIVSRNTMSSYMLTKDDLYYTRKEVLETYVSRLMESGLTYDSAVVAVVNGTNYLEEDVRELTKHLDN